MSEAEAGQAAEGAKVGHDAAVPEKVYPPPSDTKWDGVADGQSGVPPTESAPPGTWVEVVAVFE